MSNKDISDYRFSKPIPAHHKNLFNLNIVKEDDQDQIKKQLKQWYIKYSPSGSGMGKFCTDRNQIQ